jgi:hypothetical protein
MSCMAVVGQSSYLLPLCCPTVLHDTHCARMVCKPMVMAMPILGVLDQQTQLYAMLSCLPG